MIEDFEALRQTVLSCKNCKLCETRHNVVFGVGNPQSKVMFIGEGPGENEDLQGEPFVGRGGQLLDKMLTHVGLSRNENVYIANMVKCRPPKNRDPEKDELEACIGYLRNQVHLIRPKIIVCLGRIAACAIIDPGFKVTKQHGEFYDRNGTLMMGTFHPAALLRNPGSKPAALEDFLKLREKLDSLPD
ncbi:MULTISPECIES: uracil-DNA glycosylase [Anaerotruncus]|jgi:uracil-DNA glycosylase family 4|uniref:uracil-DNA glycosylase n=1 Tax=Anaerotruncus TaxID=244127 RepID=UPI00082F77E8|nr:MULTISPECIES: uracil-DNA glycosylase [Anaerotruncus]RGX54508.1 uracil-DNA glycosylase [Anaerotruncus sp. AF02-27]